MDFEASENLVLLVIFVGAFFAAGLIVLAINSVLSPGRGVNVRIGNIKHRWAGAKAPEASANVRRIAAESSFKGLEMLAGRFLPRPAEMRARLEMTGKDTTLGGYLATTIILAVVSVAFLMFYVHLAPLTAVLVGLGLGVWLPHMAVGWMVQRRREKFISLFPDAIELMVRGLKSGLPITESMNAAGQEIEEPVGSIFRNLMDTVKLGRTMDEALWEATRKLAVPEFKFFVISLSIQRETGGNLAETLQNLAEILRKRQQMRLKVKAMSSEARASAMIIGSLPFIMFGILLALQYDYMSLMFTDQRGIMMSVGGLMLMGFGIFVIWRMIKFEI